MGARFTQRSQAKWGFIQHGFSPRYRKWDDPQLAKLVDNYVKYDISMVNGVPTTLQLGNSLPVRSVQRGFVHQPEVVQTLDDIVLLQLGLPGLAMNSGYVNLGVGLGLQMPHGTQTRTHDLLWFQVRHLLRLHPHFT